MIFQRWVLDHCNGRPSEAIRVLEAANDGHPIDATRVYRGLRKPLRFPVRFAQLVMTASGGRCSLLELMDLDTIAAEFVYTNPDLQRRGLEYQAMRLERRRASRAAQRDRLDAELAAVDAELDECRDKLQALVEATDDGGEDALPAAG